jgi:hypothetical protein
MIARLGAVAIRCCTQNLFGFAASEVHTCIARFDQFLVQFARVFMNHRSCERDGPGTRAQSRSTARRVSTSAKLKVA